MTKPSSPNPLSRTTSLRNGEKKSTRSSNSSIRILQQPSHLHLYAKHGESGQARSLKGSSFIFAGLGP